MKSKSEVRRGSQTPQGGKNRNQWHVESKRRHISYIKYSKYCSFNRYLKAFLSNKITFIVETLKFHFIIYFIFSYILSLKVS